MNIEALKVFVSLNPCVSIVGESGIFKKCFLHVQQKKLTEG